MISQAVCSALAEALASDPFYQAVTPDAATHAERLQQLESYARLAIDEALGTGEVCVADPDGIAIWHTLRGSAERRQALADTRSRALQQLLSAQGYDNYVRICENMNRQLPADLQDSWYLSILGVRPGAQGQGLGRRLLAATLARADRQGAGTYLETFNPESLPFYRKLGFSQEICLDEAVTRSTYWLLSRPPG
ncbi:GNAT family N-acetyltransferase [Bordetella genomosp. 12]|uniref:GNAT family N-acetyltransferase n=1 Tax=Bordetella genomosp. 12 TaxID=463035 RepID=UPI00142E143C|nr:GNAT family N-acetyltransferase [Bordetella genomosp. 12]